jgi:hypothetical protein
MSSADFARLDSRPQDTRGDAFRMVIDDRRVTTRPEAARLIQEWTAQNSRGGIPYGRYEHKLGELGQLGGLPIDATLRKTLGGGAPALELSIRGVPSTPATLGQDLVRQDAQSLVRQLEHRVADLPALAARVEADGVKAAEEAHRTQQSRDQPFKHADALRAATTRSTEIATEMQNRQQPPPGAEAGADGAGEATDAKSAEVSELQRLSRANFPTAPGGRPASTATPASARARPPQRGNDVSR